MGKTGSSASSTIGVEDDDRVPPLSAEGGLPLAAEEAGAGAEEEEEEEEEETLSVSSAIGVRLSRFRSFTTVIFSFIFPSRPAQPEPGRSCTNLEEGEEDKEEEEGEEETLPAPPTFPAITVGRENVEEKAEEGERLPKLTGGVRDAPSKEEKEA